MPGPDLTNSTGAQGRASAVDEELLDELVDAIDDIALERVRGVDASIRSARERLRAVLREVFSAANERG